MATYAPESLLTARSYLIATLDAHPGRVVDADLDPAEVGIVGDRNHIGGYHHGWGQRRSSGDYSWSESSRDNNHHTEAARALDVGWFDVTKAGRRITLLDFNRWLIAQCAAGAPDTQDIREVIYTLDRKTVKRWDRLGRRSSGDSSHLFHTHISYFADTINRDKTALFRRFVAEATGGKVTSTGGTTMALDFGTWKPVENVGTRTADFLTAEMWRLLLEGKTAYGGTSWLKDAVDAILAELKKVSVPAATPVAVDAKAVAAELATNVMFVDAIADAVVRKIGAVAQALAAK